MSDIMTWLFTAFTLGVIAGALIAFLLAQRSIKRGFEEGRQYGLHLSSLKVKRPLSAMAEKNIHILQEEAREIRALDKRLKQLWG